MNGRISEEFAPHILARDWRLDSVRENVDARLEPATDKESVCILDVRDDILKVHQILYKQMFQLDYIIM
jgi:hypothetical protein